jgi:hypothetical protein
MKQARYPRLTPLRAFCLLEKLNSSSWNEHQKITFAREALSAHIKAALVTKRKRKRKSRAESAIRRVA